MKRAGIFVHSRWDAAKRLANEVEELSAGAGHRGLADV